LLPKPATENGFDKIVLKHAPSNTFAEIVPSCGAILYSFGVIYDNAPLNIIDHVETAADFEMNVRSSGFKSCKLSPFACRIDNGRYSFAGNEYELQKSPAETAALHGLLYNAKFEVLEHYADMERAGVSLVYSYSGADPGYPFLYDCFVTYELKEDNVLDIVTTIVNKDKGLLPIQDGWHPYFKFGGKIDALQLEFQSKEVMVFNDALIPTGETLPYDSFSVLTVINATVT
jgi:aldose 1-epimerase